MRILANVRRGAELLDKEFGPGWEDLIDLDTLELSSTCDCILGQLHKARHPRSKHYTRDGSRYTRLAREMGIDSIEGKYAFVTYKTGNGKWFTHARLNREWTRLIAGRRTAKLKAAA